jgi:hypothetical protein
MISTCARSRTVTLPSGAHPHLDVTESIQRVATALGRRAFNGHELIAGAALGQRGDQLVFRRKPVVESAFGYSGSARANIRVPICEASDGLIATSAGDTPLRPLFGIQTTSRYG